MTQPSPVRYLDPNTLEVIKTETVEEFRAIHGKPEFKRDHEERERLNAQRLTTPATQFSRMVIGDVIRLINLEPDSHIIYQAVIQDKNMADIAKDNEMSHGAVRQTVSRFRRQLRERVG